MSQRFVKYIDSEKGDWLAKKHPWAFMLLWLIAKRAKRTSTNLDGLEIGQAHIGDYKECGIPSEQIYRTAKQRLVDMGIILVCETCRTRKRATTDQRPTSKKSTTNKK